LFFLLNCYKIKYFNIPLRIIISIQYLTYVYPYIYTYTTFALPSLALSSHLARIPYSLLFSPLSIPIQDFRFRLHFIFILIHTHSSLLILSPHSHSYPLFSPPKPPSSNSPLLPYPPILFHIFLAILLLPPSMSYILPINVATFLAFLQS